MSRLEMICVESCQNDREAWYRVHTVRDGVHRMNELSIPLARRLVPKMWERYGLDPMGMFSNSIRLIQPEHTCAGFYDLSCPACHG